MPAIQVLTNADIINNITILLNVLNIFIVVCQKSDRVDIKILENNKYASIITMGLFILVNFLIVYL